MNYPFGQIMTRLKYNHTSIAAKTLYTFAMLVLALIPTRDVLGQSAVTAISRDEVETFRIGAIARLLIDRPRLDSFRGFAPDVPTGVSSFNNGSGLGFATGLFGQLPLSSQIALGVQLSYERASYDFEQSEKVGMVEDETTHSPIPVISLFELHLTHQKLVLSPSIYFRPSGVPLALAVGPQIGYLLSLKMQQSERITSPSGFSFVENGRSDRNPFDDDVPSVQPLSLGLLATLSFEFVLGAHKVGNVDVGSHLSLTRSYGHDGDAGLAGTGMYDDNLRLGAGFAVVSTISLPPCSAGYERDNQGNCVLKNCGPYADLDNAGNCVPRPCGIPGHLYDAQGNCVPKPCPQGKRFSREDGDCIWLPCSQAGYIRSASGDCVEPSRDSCVGRYLLVSFADTVRANGQLALIRQDLPDAEIIVFSDNGKPIYRVVTRCYASEDIDQVGSSLQGYLSKWGIAGLPQEIGAHERGR
jgi:hypothetical protein